jgi:dTDP-4-dehydrorhamnose 3,5-epimerase
MRRCDEFGVPALKFTETRIGGVFLVDLEPVADDRGFFARTYCEEEFRRNGLEPRIAQSSMAFNARRGTLRGMHFQREPHSEVKLVRCTSGGVYDVVIDLRADSPTFRQWFGTELTARNRRMIYIPHGIAHGYQSLEDETEISYQMSAPYRPEAAAGVRWDDPAFAVRWPLEVTAITERDRSYPDFAPA